MALTYCDLRTLQQQAYVECPKNLGTPAQQTLICNDSADPVTTEVIPFPPKNIYAEATSVAASTLTTVASYTVPAGMTFKLLRVEASGSNKAEFTVTRDGVNEAKKRSYFTEYNADFDFKGLEFTAGEVIAVKVFHTRSSVGDFEARITGIEV